MSRFQTFYKIVWNLKFLETVHLCMYCLKYILIRISDLFICEYSFLQRVNLCTNLTRERAIIFTTTRLCPRLSLQTLRQNDSVFGSRRQMDITMAHITGNLGSFLDFTPPPPAKERYFGLNIAKINPQKTLICSTYCMYL